MSDSHSASDDDFLSADDGQLTDGSAGVGGAGVGGAGVGGAGVGGTGVGGVGAGVGGAGVGGAGVGGAGVGGAGVGGAGVGGAGVGGAGVGGAGVGGAGVGGTGVGGAGVGDAGVDKKPISRDDFFKDVNEKEWARYAQLARKKEADFDAGDWSAEFWEADRIWNYLIGVYRVDTKKFPKWKETDEAKIAFFKEIDRHTPEMTKKKALERGIDRDVLKANEEKRKRELEQEIAELLRPFERADDSDSTQEQEQEPLTAEQQSKLGKEFEELMQRMKDFHQEPRPLPSSARPPSDGSDGIGGAARARQAFANRVTDIERMPPGSLAILKKRKAHALKLAEKMGKTRAQARKTRPERQPERQPLTEKQQVLLALQRSKESHASEQRRRRRQAPRLSSSESDDDDDDDRKLRLDDDDDRKLRLAFERSRTSYAEEQRRRRADTDTDDDIQYLRARQVGPPSDSEEDIDKMEVVDFMPTGKHPYLSTLKLKHRAWTR